MYRMMSALPALSALVIAFGIGSAGAQEGGNSLEMDLALAAGLKAAFTCSATFNAGQSQTEIAENELDGIYTDAEEGFNAVGEAKIDLTERRVSVAWSDTLPPRYAVWRKGFGCTQLPIGAEIGTAAYLPDFTEWPEVGSTDASSAIGSDVKLTDKSSFYDGLDAPVSFAFDSYTYGDGTRTSAVVVLAHGEVVAERYDRGIDATTPQRTWSVAKSISATIIGAANYAGLFDYKGRTALKAWETPGDPRQGITTENLLHMSSGLDSGARGNRTDRIYFGGARMVDRAVSSSLEAAPGWRWKYANNDTLLAMRALRERLDDDPLYHRFPYESLLWKIGAYRTTLETDWNGDFISSSQVWTTARDLARLGQLYLQDGVWGGERILPEGWRHYVSTPAPVQPDRSDRLGYGAQFWLLNNSDGVPADTFAALGNRGQYVIIVPSRDVVIVRRGYDVSGGNPFNFAGFTRDVLAALETAEAAKLQAQIRASAEENGELETAD
ncbi:MAG: serine hydrolase [Pseudomonadota bacterium]